VRCASDSHLHSTCTHRLRRLTTGTCPTHSPLPVSRAGPGPAGNLALATRLEYFFASVALATARQAQQPKPVCVQLRPSAVNVTLPAFTAERWRLIPPAVGRSAANSPHTAVAVGRRERQTDRRTPHRYIDPAPCTMLAVPVVDI